jgi:ankyrin repeat protein
LPNVDFAKAMFAEHMTRGGNDHPFEASNYQLKTQMRNEWLYVAGDNPNLKGSRLECPASEMVQGKRNIKPIDELMECPLAKKAGLSREEIIAIVLYTGPAFVVYNAILRRWPDDIYQKFKTEDNLFTTTIFVLVSAVSKLSRCTKFPPGTLFYRGLKMLEFPPTFTAADPSCKTPDATGFLEFGFQSTTTSKSVAIEYTEMEDDKHKQIAPKATVMVIRPSSIDRGADISEFSQFASENEVLFVPYSFLQSEGNQRLEVVDGSVITVVPVRMNVNLKTETVEELKEKKKRLHIASACSMMEDLRYELREWAAGAEAASRLQQDGSSRGTFTPVTLAQAIVEQCEAVVKRHEATAVEEYVNDGVYRALVNEMLDAVAWAREKKNLWMRDSSQYLKWLQSFSLRECNRVWQMFLRKSIASANEFDQEAEKPADSADLAVSVSSKKNSLCVQLLLSRGLVRRGVQLETNADGESVLVRAGGDGWPKVYVDAAVAAGADLIAADGDGQSGVWHAARCGHTDTLAALIAVQCDLNACNKHGASPVYAASYNGHVSCLKILLAAKADVHKCDGFGCSPVYIACQQNQPDCIPLLVSAKCDVDGKIGSDGRSRFPIIIAASKGHTACLRLLLSFGADAGRKTSEDLSALELARHFGHLECVRLLEDA